MSEQMKEGAVGSLGEGLLIIRVLLDAPGPMSLAELAQRVSAKTPVPCTDCWDADKAWPGCTGPRGQRYLAAPSPGITKFPAPNHPGAAGVSIGNRRAA